MIFGNSKIKALQAEVKKLRDLNTFSITAANIQRNIAIYPPWTIAENTERYVSTDDIYSIITFLARTAAMVPIYAYEIRDDKAAKKLKAITKPYMVPMQTKALQLKAYEDLTEEDPLYALLENPSPGISKFEFFEAIFIHLFMDGEAFILKQKTQFGVNAGKPIGLLKMHPENVIIKVSDTLPRKVVAYDYRVDGQIIYENIPAEEVIHIKYYNPKLGFNGSELRGLSPIQVLKKRLVQLDSNTDVQTAQMQNGGIETVIFDKAIPDEQSVEVTGLRQDNFYKFLKKQENAGSPYFSSGELGSIKLGSTLADMKVIESANVTFKKFCNAFAVSDVLFNNSEASTESNVEQQVKRGYTNSTLPNVMRVRDGLKMGLLYEFADKKRDIREDISEIPELQPNSKEMAEWLAQAWWVTPNEKREMMRFDKSDNPMFDQPLVPNSLQTLDDMAAIPDIPIETPNGL